MGAVSNEAEHAPVQEMSRLLFGRVVADDESRARLTEGCLREIDTQAGRRCSGERPEPVLKYPGCLTDDGIETIVLAAFSKLRE